MLKHGCHGPQSDPKNDHQIVKNPIPDSPWPPVGPRGHSFWMLAPFLHHLRAEKQATGHKVSQHVTKKLPKISDKTYFKNNSKMSLIFWLLPPTPQPEKPNDLLRTSCLSPEPPCTGTPAHTQGAGGRGRQPLGSAAPACGSRGVLQTFQEPSFLNLQM